MFFSVNTFKNALDNIKNNGGFDNGFIGFLYIYRAVSLKQPVKLLSLLKFDPVFVSNELSSAFSFSDYHIKVKKEDAIIISKNYVNDVFSLLLGNKKIDVFAFATICFNNFDLDSLEKDFIVNYFKDYFYLSDEAIELWFSTSGGVDIDFSDVNDVEGKKKYFEEDFSDNHCIDFKKNVLNKKNAGDWGASPYIQKFKPTTKVADIAAVIHSDLLFGYLENSIVSIAELECPNGFKSSNVIFYGAPGTGKSHKIDKLATDDNSTRTVFHSETQYSDFVGCLKPCMDGSNISYQFRPGPFTLALVKAANDATKQYFLVIEEINRAAAAAVFGDIFQLLDRRGDGRSQYAIDVVDMDFKHYLENNCPSLLVRGRLILPSNLSLLATMNSSDQAVMPMDSAFKRRWQFEYVSIESDTYPRGHFNLNAGADILTVSWENLSKVINDQLAGVQIPEDRLLGPWFVNENELQNSQATLAGKLAMYLWEDVLRHAHREIIFNTDKYPTLYQLIKGINANEMVFSDSIIIKLRKLGEPLTPAEA